MLFSSQKPLVALDIGSHTIKLAQLKKTKKGYELLNFGMIQLPEDTMIDGEVENPEALTEAIKSLVKSEKVKSKNIVVGISGQSVIIKKISVPLMSFDELAEMIREEADNYIPYDIDEVNLDFEIIKAEGEIPEIKGESPAESGEEEKQMDVIIVAVRKDTIQAFLDVAKEAGLKIKVMDLSAFALGNTFELNHEVELDTALALVNIGASSTNINIIENGVTAFTRDMPVGGNTVTEEVQKKLSVGFSDAEKLKLGNITEDFKKEDVALHVKAGIENICEELAKTIEMFEKTSDFKVTKIYLSGGGALFEGLDMIFKDYLGIEMEFSNSVANIKFNRKHFDPDYVETIGIIGAIPIGLAMRMAEDK